MEDRKEKKGAVTFPVVLPKELHVNIKVSAAILNTTIHHFILNSLNKATSETIGDGMISENEFPRVVDHLAKQKEETK